MKRIQRRNNHGGRNKENDMWQIINRCDPRGRKLADRHYNRQHIGSPWFTPPGRCLCLYEENEHGKALWVTTVQRPEYIHHDWKHSWVCTTFRNEGAGVASELILDAIALSVDQLGTIPDDGMISFIDPKHVKPTIVHGEPVYGWTYRKAGFKPVGLTKVNKLIVFQMQKEDMLNVYHDRINRSDFLRREDG